LNTCRRGYFQKPFALNRQQIPAARQGSAVGKNRMGTRQLILNLLKARLPMDFQAASWLRNPGNSLMPLKAALLFALTPAWASCLVELA